MRATQTLHDVQIRLRLAHVNRTAPDPPRGWVERRTQEKESSMGTPNLHVSPAMVAASRLAVFAAAAVAVIASAGGATARDAAAPVVTVTEARPAEMVVQIPITGTLVAREEVMVNPRIAGRIIMALHADTGDRVETGALLAELDRDSLEMQLEQAKAEKARAEAAVEQAQSQVALSQASLDEARKTWQRNLKLREHGTVPQSALDQSETAYLTAQASLAAARSGLAVARAQVRQAEVQLRLAELNLSYTRLTAPVGGTIAQRNARIGAVAVAGAQPMFSIIANDEIEVEAEVLETEVNLVQEGDEVRLAIAGVGQVTGSVRLIPPTVDPRTRLARLRIALPSVPGLKTGAFARGHIEAQRFSALAVPVSAILSEGGADYVLVVDDNNTLVRREVRAGVVWNGRRQILSGLAEGELVLLRAGPFFQAGDRVQPVLDQALAQAGEATQ